MPADEGIELVLFAKKQEDDVLLYQRWLTGAQYEMSFDAFKETLKPKAIKDDDEVIKDAESILTSWEVSNGNI